MNFETSDSAMQYLLEKRAKVIAAERAKNEAVEDYKRATKEVLGFEDGQQLDITQLFAFVKRIKEWKDECKAK